MAVIISTSSERCRHVTSSNVTSDRLEEEFVNAPNVVMDALSAMRPCYILPMFFIGFLFFFYGRLSWPNG